MDTEGRMQGRFFRMLLAKVNPKSIAMTIALILSILGCIMIFMGIKDDGLIDVTTPFITGKVKSGFIGISLLFISLISIIAVLYYRTKEFPYIGKSLDNFQTIKIQKGDINLEWSGPLQYWEESKHVASLLDQVATTVLERFSEVETNAKIKNRLGNLGLANDANSADAKNRAAD